MLLQNLLYFLIKKIKKYILTIKKEKKYFQSNTEKSFTNFTLPIFWENLSHQILC